MKNMIRFFFIIGLAISPISCTKVIDIDINESDTKIVVEMVGTNFENTSYLQLSMSNDLYAENSVQTISNAIVKVTDLNGITYTFTESEPGRYTSPNFLVKPNNFYDLTIIIEGDTLTASSQSFSIPSIKKLGAAPLSNEEGTDLLLNLTFSDPELEANFYRFKIWVNGEIGFQYYLTDDLAFNGSDFTISFFRDQVGSGDVVKIEMISMDGANYDFFQSRFSTSGGTNAFSAAPANLVTNIENGIGYFGMYTTDTLTYIVP